MLCLIPIINNFALVLAIVGIVLAIIAIIRTAHGQRRGRGLAVAGLIVAAVAIVGVIASQALYSSALDQVGKAANSAAASASKSLNKLSGGATADILGKDVTVDLGAFSATTDQYGIDKTALPVHIVNKASSQKSYMIQVEAVDAAGKRITDDTVIVNNLAPGQAQDETAFAYVSSDQLPAVKAATFKIASVSES